MDESSAEILKNHHSKQEINNILNTSNLVTQWCESAWPADYMIKLIHQSLLDGIDSYGEKGTVPSEPGILRKDDIRVTGEPENFYVHSTDLAPVFRKYCETLDQIISKLPERPNESLKEIIHSASWAYYCFERMHPFLDGNGRTGRLILNRILMGSRINEVIFTDAWLGEERDIHLDAMNSVDQIGRLEPLELYLLRLISSNPTNQDFSQEIARLSSEKIELLTHLTKSEALSNIWNGFSGLDMAGNPTNES